MATNWIPKIVYGSGPTTINFDYPPKGFDPEGRDIVAQGRVSESSSGEIQTSLNYLEEVREVTFEMVSSSIATALETFLQTHALLGEEFNYYPHKSEATFYTMKLDPSARRYKPQRMTPSGKYRFTLKMRRVLA